MFVKKEDLLHVKTPFVVLDMPQLIENFTRIKKVFNPDGIFYAVKANSHPAILKTLTNLGSGFEVNGEIEMKKVFDAGVVATKIINSCPVNIPENISSQYSKGLRLFVFDSKEEVNKLAALAPKAETVVRIYISNAGSVAELNARFGIPFKDAEGLVRYAISKGLNVKGVTFHVGSQCLSIGNWTDGIQRAAVLFEKFPKLELLDIGGGFPIEYDDGTLQIGVIAQTVRNAIRKYMPHTPKLYLEPGRFMVGNIGKTYARVIGVKHSRKTSWAFVDVSVFGNFIESVQFQSGLDYPIITNSKSKQILNYNIAGPTCDGTDIIRRDVRLSKLQINDRLTISRSGAYTTEYASDFNGYRRPKIYIKEP